MELIDVTPEIRRLFLEQVADEYKIFGKERILFLCRFDYPNKKCKDTEIFEQLKIDKSLVSTPRKNLTSIYNKLGFPRTKNGRGASPKGESPFNKASDWLWIEKFNEWLKLQQNPNVQMPILNDDEWLKICHTKLEDQQKQIRKNASKIKFELDFPPVPLGLVERKHQQRRDENVDRGEVYQLEKEVIAKIYEHNDFLEQVINQNPAGKNKHISIVGEPGAGKTTLLSAIASYIKNENKELPIVISLGSLQGMTLEEYILKKWLPDTMRVDITPTSEIEKQLKTRFYKDGVWLLLDGVDEMGESSPTAALNKISQALTDWLGKARVILTCRLNVWDANPLNNDLSGFDTYKTQEFNPEQVDQFIEKWFKCDDDKIQRGEELKAKLREPGKERICELVTNPLRLSTTELIYIIPNCLEIITILIDLIKNDNNYIYREVIVSFSSIKSNNQEIINVLWDKLHEVQHHIKRYLINNYNLDEEYINRLSEYNIEIIASLSKIYQGSIKDIKNQIQIIHNIPYKLYGIIMASYLLKIQPNIPELVEFMTNSLHDNDDEVSLSAARELLEIFPNHQPAIYKIISMLDSDFIDKKHLKYLVNNSTAIETLNNLLKTEENDLKCLGYVEDILEISINNQTAIDTLFVLVNNYNNIPNNEKETISLFALILLCGLWTRETLIWYYSNEQIKNIIHHIFNISKYYNYNNVYKQCLENIVQRHQSTEIVMYIIDFLRKENEVNNTNYDDNYEILWHCAQNMRYPEFYRAWHGELKHLENQFTDTHSLLSQLQPTEKTGYISIINTANFQLNNDVSEIAKLLCTRIFKEGLNLPARNIPKISGVADLERELLVMTEEVLEKQYLALIFNEIEPTETLINICRMLANAREIHIAFITEQPLDAPLKGFPNQPNLLNVIQHWINEIG
jgi:energy-coupling factor transporter ATP-binding protein EcfA2